MATGFMALSAGKNRKSYFKPLSLALILFSGALMAQEVGLAGIMGSKAMLMINGADPRFVRVGESLDGVKLLSIQDDRVVVEIGGKKRPLAIGQHAVGAGTGDGSGKVVLTADTDGHFQTTGVVNGGTSVRFLVDTGASAISLGANDARRIGLDFNRGAKGLVQTANGLMVVAKVKLDSVRIGDITLHNVDAMIQQNDMPVALLGMSFLNHLEMQREGSTMTLKKRF